jgi:hypothetical protein
MNTVSYNADTRKWADSGTTSTPAPSTGTSIKGGYGGNGANTPAPPAPKQS